MIVRRLLPQVALNPFRFDTTEARKMFAFSLRLYVTQAAVAVHNQVEKVFLALLVGVAPVGWYDIASDVALKVRGAIGFILSPVLPAASELNALGDESRMRELYYRRTNIWLYRCASCVLHRCSFESLRGTMAWARHGNDRFALERSPRS